MVSVTNFVSGKQLTINSSIILILGLRVVEIN